MNIRDWEKELDKNIELWGVAEVSTEGVILEIKTFIKDLLSQSRQEIKKDLLKIADDGEYEDLRREVENYFK
jgi:hypothetical protein